MLHSSRAASIGVVREKWSRISIMKTICEQEGCSAVQKEAES